MSYEFTEEQDKKITELTQNMLIASILFVVIGLLALTFVLVTDGNVFFIIFGITMLVIGVTFYTPIDNFNNIVETEGNDIEELITAFTEIRFNWGLLLVVLVAHKLNLIISFVF